MREFETTYVVQPEISDEGCQAIADRLDGIFQKNGSTRLIFDDQGKRKLAYEIKKFQKGRYVTVNYFDGGAVVPELERSLRLDESILRFLSIRVLDEVEDIDGRVVAAREEEKLRAERAKERAEREAEEARAREAAEAERAREEAERAAQAEAAAAERSAEAEAKAKASADAGEAESGGEAEAKTKASADAGEAEAKEKASADAGEAAPSAEPEPATEEETS